MKCNGCGFEREGEFSFCPGCGKPVEQAPLVNPAAEKILSVLKDDLYMILCILLSVGCAISVFSGSIPLLAILQVIFMWIVYSSARKNIADAKNLRNVSGVVFASYVINYVVAALVFVVVAILAIALVFVPRVVSIDSGFLDILGEIDPRLLEISQPLIAILGWVIIAVFVAVAIGVLLVNIFGMRKLHRLAKSTYMSIESHELRLENVNGAKNWLLAFGILSGISALSSIVSLEVFAALSGIASAASEILAYVLIKKHLS